MGFPKTVEDVTFILGNAERLGAKSDYPEGNRYVQISDTLCGMMVDALKADPSNREAAVDDRTMAEKISNLQGGI